MKENTCFIVGHRKLKQAQIEMLSKRVKHEIEVLLEKGVTTFISGGAMGFDAIVASHIILLKKDGIDIKLIFALPCPSHGRFWDDKSKVLFEGLLNEADEVLYTSEAFSKDCIAKRDKYMVDNSSYCLCVLIQKAGGTGRTVQSAYDKKLSVINIGHPLYKPSAKK